MANENVVSGCMELSVKGVVIIVSASLLLIGIAMLLIPTLLPYEAVKAHIDGYAMDRSVEFYTSGFHASMLRSVAILGSASTALSILVYLFRGRIEKFLRHAITTCKPNVRNLVEFFGPKPGHVTYSCFLFILTVLGISLRIHFVDQPIRYDEAFTFLTYASRPFYVAVSFYSEPNNHVFHTLLVHISYSLFGDQLWSIRLPAFVSGTLAIPASYLAATLLYDRRAGIVSACLVAVSSILIEYSTNARGHSLVALFALVILILAVYLKDRQNWVAWSLFVVVSAAGLYTVPSMLFPLGGIFAWMVVSNFVRDLRAPILRQVMIAGVVIVLLTALLYAPIFVVTGIDSVMANRDTVPHVWTEFWSLAPEAVRAIWDSLTRDVPHIVTLILTAGFLTALVWHRSISAHRVPVILVVLGWCLLVVLVRRPGGMVFPRNWLFLVPLILMTSGAGVAFCFGWLERRLKTKSVWLLLGAVGVMFGFLGNFVIESGSIFVSKQTGTLMDAEKIAMELSQRLEQGDVIVAQVPSDFPLIYYFKKRDLPIEHFDVENAESRMFVVVNHIWSQTLEGVLTHAPLPKSIDWTPPEPVAHFRGATLYVSKVLRRSAENGSGSVSVDFETRNSARLATFLPAFTNVWRAYRPSRQGSPTATVSTRIRLSRSGTDTMPFR